MSVRTTPRTNVIGGEGTAWASVSGFIEGGNSFYVWLGFCSVLLAVAMAGSTAPGRAHLASKTQTKTMTTRLNFGHTERGTTDADDGRTGQERTQKQAGAGAADAPGVARYAAEVFRRIDQHKRYPREEEQAGHRGTVALRLVVGARGELRDLALVTRSTYNGFNEEALSAVRRAGSFPPIPTELARNSLELHLVLRFVPD